MPLTRDLIKKKTIETEKKVKILDLARLDVTDDDIPLVCDYLQENPEIIGVDLSHNSIHAQGIAQLAEIKTIEYLNLSRNFGVRNDGAYELARMNNLKALRVEWCSIERTGVKALATLPSLQALDVRSNCLTFESVAALLQNPSLRELAINGGEIFGKEAPPNPTWLDYQVAYKAEFLELLKKNTRLTTLDITVNKDDYELSKEEEDVIESILKRNQAMIAADTIAQDVRTGGQFSSLPVELSALILSDLRTGIEDTPEKKKEIYHDTLRYLKNTIQYQDTFKQKSQISVGTTDEITTPTSIQEIEEYPEESLTEETRMDCHPSPASSPAGKKQGGWLTLPFFRARRPEGEGSSKDAGYLFTPKSGG
ncbi:leucine-rich repeat domain-containing protein [Legionella spiritensis]|uniref:Gala protein type 1, 3 or 4 n=1 Tax=Legionella spiritensis TaxID=452 RepID=A0A0W0Z987_LEGSP|nr:hypothetical protein [Legionella spiritensis]KTD65491.1 Gala protein type 1, 3 or 4 [Legionella spiritensis]SNV35905.1 Gala protein type 1, 3 or 4 [Legionella spiritensis]